MKKVCQNPGLKAKTILSGTSYVLLKKTKDLKIKSRFYNLRIALYNRDIMLGLGRLGREIHIVY